MVNVPKFIKSEWFMLLFMILFAPVGIALLFYYHNDKYGNVLKITVCILATMVLFSRCTPAKVVEKRVEVDKIQTVNVTKTVTETVTVTPQPTLTAEEKKTEEAKEKIASAARAKEAKIQEAKEAKEAEINKPKIKIEDSIKARINEGEYTNTVLDSITINKNLGESAPNNTYIALVYIDFNVKNTRNTGNPVMRMYSDDLVSTLVKKGHKNISEACVFWTDKYNNRNIKYAYEYKNGAFYISDIAGE